MVVVLVMAAIGAVLFGIDMLICKINPKAGYVVAIFNLPFLPVGIVTFILTQKYLEKKLGVSDLTRYFRESAEAVPRKKKTVGDVRKVPEKTPEKAPEKVPENVHENTESKQAISKDDLGRAEDWDLEYATSTDDLHMRMIALQGCKNLEEFKRVRPDLDGEKEAANPDKIKMTAETVKSSDGLLSIIIEEGPRRICRCEFDCCHSIGSVVIPEGVEAIGDSAFARCDRLKRVVLPNSLITIGEDAFNGCRGLTSIVIPEGVKFIKKYAFRNCYNLTSVVIPKSVCAIADNAFNGCGNLDEKTKARISGLSAKGCNKTENLPDTDKADNDGLLSVIIEKGVSRICASAFSSCMHIVSVVIPDGVELIQENAFKRCYKLTSVVIPDSVRRIEEGTFSYCESLEKAVLPKHITAVEKDTFYMCTALSSVLIPQGVRKIDKMAFAYCSSLASVSIPESVTDIGVYAFTECSNLASVTIGNKACDVKSNSFFNCKKLEAEPGKKVSDGGNDSDSWLYPYYEQYCKRHSEDFKTFKGYASYAKPTNYAVPMDDPNYDYDCGMLDPNKHPTEFRIAKNGECYYAVW